jgi:sensor histidine kinase YesM
MISATQIPSSSKRAMNWRTAEKYLFGRVFRNALFWVLFTLYHISGQPFRFDHYFLLMAVMLISYGLPCYFNNLILIPRLLLNRKPWRYLLSFVLLLAVTTVGSYYSTIWINRSFEGLNYMGELQKVPLPFHAFPSLLMFIMLAAGKFTADAFHNQRKLESLENEKLAGELESLKSQMNPHFLFNSLNTIYGLAKRDNALTAQSIMRLSDILRYVLYDCDAEQIRIAEEIRFIENYTAFARLRSRKNAKVELDIDYGGGEELIAPLILLPFVENSVKHGLGKSTLDPWMKVSLALEQGKLYFECANSKSPAVEEERIKNSSGIGLKNVKRRLDLLYPQKYRLDISEAENEFKVKLVLDL